MRAVGGKPGGGGAEGTLPEAWEGRAKPKRGCDAKGESRAVRREGRLSGKWGGGGSATSSCLFPRSVFIYI